MSTNWKYRLRSMLIGGGCALAIVTLLFGGWALLRGNDEQSYEQCRVNAARAAFTNASLGILLDHCRKLYPDREKSQ